MQKKYWFALLLVINSLCGCSVSTTVINSPSIKAETSAYECGSRNLAIVDKKFFADNSIDADKKKLDENKEPFVSRWNNSKGQESSALLFFRSYVRPYYAYVNDNFKMPQDADITSVKGNCFGDAHPDNFGYVEDKSGNIGYLYNDLDDAGPDCPIAFDALRYFTALRLLKSDLKKSEEFSGKQVNTSKEIDQYIEVINDKKAKELPETLQKLDLDAIREKMVRKNVMDGKLNEGKKGKSLTQVVDSVVLKNIKDIASEYGQVLDIKEASGHGGGSFGITRYWALVKQGGIFDILEFKQEVQYSTAIVGIPVIGNHLEWSIDKLWAPHSFIPKLYKTAVINGKNFIVRSRVQDSIDLSELTIKPKKVFNVQVGILAYQHKQYLAPKGKDWLRTTYADWLKVNSKCLAATFDAIYNSK